MKRNTLLVVLCCFFSACGTPNPLYCDTDADCRNANLGFCDLLGEHPDSNGVRHTCIAEPIFLDISVVGRGVVVSQPSGINCGADCRKSYAIDTSVILTATADTGALFVDWSGECAGQADCTVTMDMSRSLTATFAEASTVTVERTGTDLAAGRVVSTPSGIDCPGTCSFDFAVGSNVALTATETTGGTFIGWSGDAVCPGFAGCTFAVASLPMTVQAMFNVSGEYIYDIVSNVTAAGFGEGRAVVFDSAGNLFVMGTFGRRLEFQTTFVASPTSRDVFVAKFDPAGQLLWLQSFGGAGDDYGESVQVDAVGDVYLVLQHWADIVVGGSHPGSGLVVAKLAGADGAVKWSRTAPRFGGGTGPVYVAIAVGGGPIVAGRVANGLFVQWYSSSGVVGDSVRFGTTGDWLSGMVADDAGNAIVTGTFANSIDFNGTLPGGTATSVGGRDIFLSKVGQGQSLSWVRAFGTPGDDWVSGLGIAAATGEVWIAGQFQGTLDFGGSPIVASGTDTYLAKYAADDGQHLLSLAVDANFGSLPAGSLPKLVVDVRGNVGLVGEFGGGQNGVPIVDLGGGPIFSLGGGRDIVFASFDRQGQHRWSRGVGGTTDVFTPVDAVFDLAVDASGRFAATGRISTGADFGGGPVMSRQFADTVFVAVYGP